MAYQWYNEQRYAAKDMLSVDTDPNTVEPSRFPPALDVTSLSKPEDHSVALTSDAFQKIESGNFDLDELISSSRSYSQRFAGQKSYDLSSTSMLLGPSEAVNAAGGVANLPLGATDKASDGVNDNRFNDVTQTVAVGYFPDEQEHVDHRNDSGRREKGNALTGIKVCVEDALLEIWELVKEIALLLKDAGLASAWYVTNGWVGSEQDWISLKSKLNELKEEIEKVGSTGIELIAAIDVHVPNIKKINPVIIALSSGLNLFYTPEEWKAAADRGKAKAEGLAKSIEQTFKEDPDYAVGYTLCVIATMLSPRAIVSILKNVRKAGKLGDLVKAAEGPAHRGGRPAPKAPEPIIDGKPEQGKPTPQGRGDRDLEKGSNNTAGPVSPDYVTTDTPGGVRVDNPDGSPSVAKPGQISGVRTADELRAAGKTEAEVAQYMQEVELSQALQRHGYDVDMIDDPLRKSKNNETRPGVQRLREGDFPFDRGVPQKSPDLRLNNVIFDIKRVSSPNAMLNQMKGAIQKGQTQNFVMHTDPRAGSIRDYYRKLQTLDASRPDSEWIKDLKQVILVDQRTGQTLFWHR